MPGDRQVFGTAMNVADRHRWDSRWAEAAKEYQRALEEFPEDLAARGGLGFCYMQTKQWKLALVEYEYILQRDPGNVIALSKTAELYVILGRREQAYTGYQHLAELYAQAGQGPRAEAAWQKAVQLSPGDPEPHEHLAAYYAEKKDIPLLIQERLAAAQGYLLHNNLTAACTQCEEVLRVDSTNAQARLLLAQMKGELRQSSSSPQQGASAAFSQAPGATGTPPGVSAGPLAFTGAPATGMVAPGNISGGNTSIMGNMGSAGNFGGMGNPGQAVAPGGPNGGGSASRKRITASQVTGVLRQAQTFQTQGRYNDAIDLCEQILESGFDRPDARYFLGWLYQEQQRWDDAIRQFQMLLNDPDYALSCYYALGQCYRARGDLRTATVHFDEAVDRVNLDALTAEESDQLVQLCQEAAEAHRMLGEQEQALTVYNALLGFLRSRGWNEKVAQVEFMLQQLQNAPVPPQPMTPQPAPQAGATYVMPPEMRPQQAQPSMPDASTMMFNMGGPQSMPAPPPMQPVAPAPTQGANSIGELPDWLTGILNESEKSQPDRPAAPPQAPPAPNMEAIAAAETSMMYQVPPSPIAPPAPPAQPTSTSWLTDDARSGNATRIIQPDQMLPAPPLVAPASGPLPQEYFVPGMSAPPMQAAPPPQVQASLPAPELLSPIQQYSPASRNTKDGAEELLSKIAGSAGKDESLQRVAKAVLASTASLPDGLRMQVVQAMQDIQRYIEHGLLNPAIDECLRVIDMAPQYLDVHQVLCEIYVRQGKVEQAITKYAILIDTYIANGRTDDAIETYRRILQLEPNNLTYRVRLINLLSSQGNKEDLLRERTMAAESYLRLGYMDRALTELEQALQESPTSVPTRLNYALALQKLGRTQQAMSEYQRVLQVDPRSLVALVRWNILMITGTGSSRTTNLEVLTRIRWQLRGEGQRKYEMVVREYNQAGEMQPNNADIHFALGQVHQQAGNYDKAVDEYQLAMRDSVVEVLARISMAHCLLAQGKPEQAIQQLEQALQTVRRAPTSIDPAIWAARPREEGEEHQAPEVEISMLLAKAYRRAGKEEQMEAVLRRVKQTTAYQDEVASELAEISARQGDVDSALQEYSDLVRHYLSKRQGENALNVLNEMVRMAPQDPRAHAELAEIYINRGLLDEGIAELRLLADIQARRGQPTEASTAICQIANIYAEMGNNEDALSSYQRSVELSPNDMNLLREVVGFCSRIGRTREATHYQTTIARHYFETQQIKESVAALQQLIAIDRTNLDAYDMLGQTYQSVGEYEQASRVYRNLAKIRPDSSIARERLATLQELRSR